MLSIEVAVADSIGGGGGMGEAIARYGSNNSDKNEIANRFQVLKEIK